MFLGYKQLQWLVQPGMQLQKFSNKKLAVTFQSTRVGTVFRAQPVYRTPDNLQAFQPDVQSESESNSIYGIFM